MASATSSFQLVFPESALAHRFLDGLHGLEIGAAAHNPFGLNTRNVGRTSELHAHDYAVYQQHQLEMCGSVATIDIPADAAAIPVPDSSEDFVIHSHVWEHLPDPLRALEEWVRIVRDGGYILTIVPKRDADPYDRTQSITPLRDFFLYYHLRADSAARQQRQFGMVSEVEPHHFTIFSPEILRTIAIWFNVRHQPQLTEAAFLETDDKVGNGHLICWQVHKPA